jgi:hypothetical protein
MAGEDALLLVQIVLAGGYPEALCRTSWPRRQKWFGDYIKAIIERDVRDIAHIDHARLMPRLLRMLAHRSGLGELLESRGASWHEPCDDAEICRHFGENIPHPHA